MNKIYKTIRNAALVAAVAAAGTAVANAYTADDLCGKIVGEVFFQNGLMGSGMPTAFQDGEFTKNGNYLVLSRFRDCTDVKFQFEGNRLKLVKDSYSNVNGYSEKIRTVSTRRARSYYGIAYNFRNEGPDYYGTITSVNDGLGTLKVTFDNGQDNMLQFRRYSSWSDDLGTANDYFHTYEKVELYIYPFNANMESVDGDGNTENVKLQVQATDKGNNKKEIFIRNWSQNGGSGLGYNYEWNETGGTAATNTGLTRVYYKYTEKGGIKGVLDYSNGTVKIDPCDVAGYSKMTPKAVYTDYYDPSEDNVFWLWWTFYPGNLILCGDWNSSKASSTAVTGTFTESFSHSGSTMWHKNCGGDLATVKMLNMTFSPWKIYADFEPEASQFAGVWADAQSSVINAIEDQTFDAAISSVSIAHDPTQDVTNEFDPELGTVVKKGFYRVKVKIGNFVNKDNVDYVDLYCIEGSHTHCGTVNHDDAVGYIGSVSVSAPVATLGEFPVYPSIIRDAEGHPVYGDDGNVKVNKDLTFYVKAHYKTPASSAPGVREAAPLESTFHALTTKNANDVPTAVDLSEATGLNVEDVGGGIIVHAEGDAAVQVYNMSGMLVAAGNTNETIAIDATGVMLVRVNGKVFKIMK